jgi:hypothetical protein
LKIESVKDITILDLHSAEEFPSALVTLLCHVALHNLTELLLGHPGLPPMGSQTPAYPRDDGDNARLELPSLRHLTLQRLPQSLLTYFFCSLPLELPKLEKLVISAHPRFRSKPILKLRKVDKPVSTPQMKSLVIPDIGKESQTLGGWISFRHPLEELILVP